MGDAAAAVVVDCPLPTGDHWYCAGMWTCLAGHSVCAHPAQLEVKIHEVKFLLT